MTVRKKKKERIKKKEERDLRAMSLWGRDSGQTDRDRERQNNPPGGDDGKWRNLEERCGDAARRVSGEE